MTVGPTPVLPDRASVVNLGLPLFAEAAQAQGAEVVNVDWRPPASGDADAVRLLADTYGKASLIIDAANAEVARRLDQGSPMLTGVATAGDVVPGLGARTILHAGPPIAYAEACDPLRRSMRAAVVAEGWATDPAAADVLLSSGDVGLGAANEHHAVVPMATALGPSMPVWVVDNRAGGTTAYAPIGQGPGDVAWFGRDSQGAIDRLVFLREVAGPRLDRIVSRLGEVDVMALAAQGVQMGDDVHMRTQASTNLLLRSMLPGLATLAGDEETVAFAEYLSTNHLFFLTLVMAAAKSLTLWAEEVPGASVVTTMARNGTTFGVKLAGDTQWHITQSPPVQDALYYAGYDAHDAAPDIGDSAVLELVGLGGPAAAGSPAVAAFLGGSMADAARATQDMVRICLVSSSRFTLPTMDFRGTPVAVDARRVVETGITPKVNTGVLHVSSGVGQIGAGVATAPLTCFTSALHALRERAEGTESR